MRFSAKTALCLAFSAVIPASAAHADSAYQPYYAQDTARDNYQFSTAPAAYPAPPQAAAPQSANATESSIFHFNNAVWASAGTSFLNYKENIKPIPDSEHGWLPSIAAGASYMTHTNTYFSLSGSDTLGNAHYNGATFDSNTNSYDIPVQSTTQETIYVVDGQIGQGLYATNNVMFMPYVDVDYRHWKRDLNSTQTEIYQNFDLMGGMKLQVTPIDRLLLELHGAGGTTIGAHMDTGGERYNLGSAGVETGGGKVGFDLTPSVELFTAADYTHFRYAGSGSNIVTINDVQYTSREPGSGTGDTTVRVGMAYHFR